MTVEAAPSVEPTPVIGGDAAPVAAAPVAAVETPVAVAEVVAPEAVAAVETPAEAGLAEAAEPAETPAEPAAEAAPEGEKPEGEADPAPEGDKASQFPTYEPFKLVEGLELAPEQSAALNNLLGKHNLSQEAAQEIVDFGSAILKGAQDRLTQQQNDVFAETRRGWVKDFEKQAGNRRNTMLNDAKQAIADAVPDAKQRQELWNVLALTGAGDHPAVIRAFANIGKRARERGAPLPTAPAKTTPNTPWEGRYGRKR